MAKEKTFPLEFESKRPVYFYPAELADFSGDILEIGPGRGDLLLWHAAQDASRQCVGIELALWRYHKLLKRIERHRLANVSLIRGNARILLPKHFHAATFERIYVLFPDPWPKPRHSFHRLLNVAILSHLGSILRPGGEIVLASDEQPYVDWVIENTQQVPSLILDGSPYYSGPRLIPSGNETWFESLWRQKGKEIYYLRIVKK